MDDFFWRRERDEVTTYPPCLSTARKRAVHDCAPTSLKTIINRFFTLSRLRCPTLIFGDKSPRFLSTAAQPCVLASSATGSARTRFPHRLRIPLFPYEKKKSIPTNVGMLFFLAEREGFEPSNGY